MDIAGCRPGPDRLSDAAASPPERHTPKPAVITAMGQNLNIRVFTGVVPSIKLLVQLLSTSGYRKIGPTGPLRAIERTRLRGSALRAGRSSWQRRRFQLR